MREAHCSHNKLSKASAAGASKELNWGPAIL
jgi:hypothetical protein